MLNSTVLRNGTIFSYKNELYKVLNYEHKTKGRGGAVIKVKVQDLNSGVIKEVALGSSEKVDEADVENKNLQFLYTDGDTAHFMDESDYSQHEIDLKSIENEAKFLVEGHSFQVLFHNSKPISVTISPSMVYKVTDAPEAVKGNTSTSATKTITLENGLQIEAPLFIKEGDTVKINTSTCTYTERTSS